jgi:nitroreductase
MTTWKTLFETAIQAPSPHNVQPWRIKIINDREAELFIDIHRTLPKEDITGSFIILTMGIFIESLSIVAANNGKTISYELLKEPTWYADTIINPNGMKLLPFARLRLEDGVSNSTDYPNSLFLSRRTSRLTLDNRSVPDAAKQSLSDLAVKYGQRYEQITDQKTIEPLLQLNITAVFEDLNLPSYHDEIVEWFRFTSRAAVEHRDGLDFRCMNASRPAFWLSAKFPKLMQGPVVRSMLRKIYRIQLANVPTIGILAGAFWDPADAFKTGRFLMRFWLETAKHNLYIHPYGNLVTNKPAAKLTLERTGVPGAWLIFKIGYSKEPPKSYRRSVEEILVD